MSSWRLVESMDAVILGAEDVGPVIASVKVWSLELKRRCLLEFINRASQASQQN